MAASLQPERQPGTADGRLRVRIGMLVSFSLALLLLGFTVGRAFDRDETSLTVQVSSADHEDRKSVV